MIETKYWIWKSITNKKDISATNEMCKNLKIEISQVYFQFLDNLRKQNDNLIQRKKERKSLIKTNSMIRKQNN